MSQKHQRQQRNKETVRNHELKPETNSFEEFFGYYESIENDISRIPPYSDVEECYKTQWSQYLQKILLYHPVKNQDKTAEEKVNSDQQYQETQETMDKVREAYNCFTMG